MELKDFPFLPDRTNKPRAEGLTMMMDKGLSKTQAESFCESSADFTDLVKFGFGTGLFARQIREKIDIYTQFRMEPCFGGTLFESFIVRNRFDDFRRFVSNAGVRVVEVSDGSMKLDHEEKLHYIKELSKDFRVLSEVGYKVKGIEISDEDWVKNMKTELDAGAWKVIAEARESGTIGIYNADGSANTALITNITRNIEASEVLWEAPNKAQQVWFINIIGANVNLGNIAANEVVALEALRL
jgi:phosphosulfolactate synthase